MLFRLSDEAGKFLIYRRLASHGTDIALFQVAQ